MLDTIYLKLLFEPHYVNQKDLLIPILHSDTMLHRINVVVKGQYDKEVDMRRNPSK